jgi:hypothetical protein
MSRQEVLDHAVRRYWSQGGIFRETLRGIAEGTPVNLFAAHQLIAWIKRDAMLYRQATQHEKP